MRLRTALRVMPAVWLAVPIALLAALYATLVYPSDGYGLGATTMGTGTLPFVAGLAGIAAAWEGGRLRRSGIWAVPAVRSRLEIAAWATGPAVLAGLLGILVAVAVLLARSGAAVPDARALAVAVVELVTWCTVGFTAGVLLPFAVAGPLALLLPLFWFAFVPAVYPVWLRHVTGMFRDCCGLPEDLAPAAVAASLIAAAGIVGACVVLLSRFTRWRRVAGASVALLAGIGLGVVLVGGMTYAPVVPRDSALLACREQSGLTLCVWPEHVPAADRLLVLASDVRDHWIAAGIQPPAVFTEAGRGVAPAGSLAVQFTGTAPDDVVRALAEAMTPQQPECIDPTSGLSTGTTGGIAAQWLLAWYAAAGGMSPDRLAEEYGSEWGIGGTTLDPLPTVDALWKVSPEARRAWAARAVAYIATCEEVEVDLTVKP